MADSPPGISAAPKDDNLRHFDVTVAGPESSPYEGEPKSFRHGVYRSSKGAVKRARRLPLWRDAGWDTADHQAGLWV
jgi:hypothetical protein